MSGLRVSTDLLWRTFFEVATHGSQGMEPVYLRVPK